MPDAIPLYDDGDYLPCVASAAVIGRRFVAVSGNRSADGNLTVAHADASAGAKVLGVAQFDADPADAEDGHVTVAAGVNLIVPVTAAAALVAGDSVTSDATGQAVAVAGAAGTVQHAAGVVVDAAAAGADAFVRLLPHSVTV